MKNTAILLLGIGIGYLIFSSLNPTPTETFTVKTRTITQTNTVPVAVRDTLYHAPDSEIAPKPEPAKIDIKVEPVTETKTEYIQPKTQAPQKNPKFILGKHKQDFGFKSFLGFNQLPFLSSSDSKIVKIQGQYNGLLKFYEELRTGRLEKANLNLTEKKAIFNVIDTYDNPDENYSLNRPVAEIFRSVPGDENLLMMVVSSEHSLVFDLRKLPALQGLVYKLNLVVGEINLNRKQDKK